jgi:hypothetical protein
MRAVWSTVWVAAIAAACAPPVVQHRAARPAVRVENEVRPTAARPPPPISGGTMIVTRDATRAVISDPMRDRVWIIELEGGLIAAGRFQLRPGDEPGRIAEDGAGRVHVLLRGSGEIASFDPIGYRALARREACDAPRGIAWDETEDVLHVACAEGTVATFDPAGGDARDRRFVASDLRDVVIDDADGRSA